MRDFYPKTLVEVKRQIWIFFIDVGALHLISLKGSYKQAFPFQPCKTPVKASRRYQVVGLVLAPKGRQGHCLPQNLGVREVLRKLVEPWKERKGTSMCQIVTRLSFFLGRH